MQKNDTKPITLLSYRGTIPYILIYQVITKGLLFLTLSIFRKLDGLLLWNGDVPKFSVGTIPHLARTWQGWILVFLGFILLTIYTLFDVNFMIIVSEKILHRKRIRIGTIFLATVESVKYFLSPAGIFCILAVTLYGPLIGAPLGISLTTNLSVPEFIMAVINDNPVLKVLYISGLIVLSAVILIYVFTFHFTLLGRENVSLSARLARQAMFSHWKDFIKEALLYMARTLILFLAASLFLYFLPIRITDYFTQKGYVYHLIIVFFTIIYTIFVIVFILVFEYFTTMKLTVLYERYSGSVKKLRPPRPRDRFWIQVVLIFTVMMTAIFAALTSADFDTYYPSFRNTKIIAHRAGGYLANENTVLALKEASKYDVYGAEIDVQRTRDGYYIINHDTTFKRNTGVDKKPGDMTLKEIRKLKVRDNFNPTGVTTKVATLNEMVDAARKYHVHLFIELKGESADRKMAREVYDAVDRKGMLDNVTFISMNFDTINFLENIHSDADTGYLCFYSFGSISRMKCDALLLETEAAVQTNINSAHSNGKRVYVWTVNSLNGITEFMNSNVDGIITDEVKLSYATREAMKKRSDETRVIERLYYLITNFQYL